MAMSFFLEHRPWQRRWRTRLARALVTLGIAAMATIVPLPASPLADRSPTQCARVRASVARYCGTASARLSVFPDVLFRGGSCARKRITGIDLLQVRIGAKALDGSRTNGGLPYFSLGIAESRSMPASGNVIAYDRSQRWFGRVASLRGDAGGGTFVAQGIAGSRGRAGGRFSC
jgi:hypothetical protein